MEAYFLGASLRWALEIEARAERDVMLDEILKEWIQEDPVSAANYAYLVDSPRIREELVRRVMGRWAVRDSAGALNWAARIADPDRRRSALIYACTAMANDSPEEAVLAALDYDLAAAGNDLLERLTVQWARTDLSAARQWVEIHPAGKRREALIPQVAFVVSQTKPAEAAVWVIDEIPEGAVRDEAVISVLHQWALQDLDGAMAWLDGMPEGPLYARALSELEAYVTVRLEETLSADR